MTVPTHTPVRLALTCIAATIGLLLFAAPASAEKPAFLFQFGSGYGSEPFGPGKLQFSEAIQGDPLTAHVVIGGSGDDGMSRISEFTPWGRFVRAFGWDVAPGAVNEQQEVRVRAASGGFKLTFEGSSTTDLPFNATDGEVQSALTGLPTIGGAGGSVVVEASPGSTDGAVPFIYVVAFKGALGGLDVPALVASQGATPLGGGVPSTVLEARTRAQGTPGGTGLESCTTESGCKAAVPGDGTGQLRRVYDGLAVDSAGAIYVRDVENLRVQKFSAGGQFIWMAGGDVNKTKVEEGGSTEAQRNLCTASSGDTCQVGTAGTGSGQFTEEGIGLALGPGGVLFVGDSERIQRFSPGGEYLGDLPDPDEALKEKQVLGLAADPARSRLYLYTRTSTPPFTLHNDVSAFDATSGALLGKRTVSQPWALAVDPEGNLFAVEGVKTQRPQHVVQFDPNGKPLAPDEAEEAACKPLLEQNQGQCELFAAPDETQQFGLRGIGTGPAGDLYVANVIPGVATFIAAYGPPPVAFEAPPPAPPEITSQYAATVTDTEATLRAEINPHFFSGGLGTTTYYLQYATAACIEAGGWEAPCVAEKPAAPGATLKAGVVEEDVTTAPIVLSGLAPDTAYRYRFTAEGSGAPGQPIVGVGGKPGQVGADAAFTTYTSPSPRPPCPANAAFRSGASALLPDCRAYEMVSPLDKENGDIRVLLRIGDLLPAVIEQSSSSGGRLAYGSYRSFGDAPSAPWTSQYIAERGPGGWQSHAISPPRPTPIDGVGSLAQTDTEFRYFSEDLCRGWLGTLADPPLAPGAVAGFPNLYRRTDAACGGTAYEAITTVEPPAQKGGGYFPELQGVSADEQKVVFVANDKLTADAPPVKLGGFTTPLLYGKDASGLRYLCILPDGSPSAGPCTAGGPVLTYASRNQQVRLDHALSADASRLYWTDAGGSIYLRRNPFASGAECEKGSSPCSFKVAGTGSRYWGAAENGSRAYYTREGKLFEYDAGSKAGTQVAAAVAGVAGISTDATRLYFVSGEDLDEGGPAQAGANNLYLRQLVKGAPSIRFIAALTAADANPDPQGYAPSAVAMNPDLRATRLSPDGTRLVFISSASLTGYDNTDLENGQADVELYLYDATANGGDGRLLCISCNPSGARPAGIDIAGAATLWAAGWIPAPQNNLHETRVFSADGSRLYFESSDALVLSDTNATTDVYQWEAPGTGTCTVEAPSYSPANGGCIDLVSTGQSPRPSGFVEADPSGENVFFSTLSSLQPADYGLIDIYDARIGGGFPQPAAPPGACEGEACQPPPAPPADPTPASSTFQGAGNVVEPAKPKKKKKHRAKKRPAKHDRRTNR